MKRFSALLLGALALSTFLSSCQPLENDPNRSIPTPLAKEEVSGDYQAGPIPCQAFIPYKISYELLNAAEFNGHDLAVRALAGPPIDLGSNCECDSLKWCVTLTFPISQVVTAGTANYSGPPLDNVLQPNGLGSFIGCEDPRDSTGTIVNPMKVCLTQNSDRVLYFDLDPGLPAGYDLNDAVIELEGICIVDNVDDTNDPVDPVGGEGNGPGGGEVVGGSK